MLTAFLLLSVACATVSSNDEDEAYVRDLFF